ncbi:MAG TPA: histidine phosphatase family protein [Puia sp.]|jgi:phosphohistidine phosphatase|nr:histidine phosphatase family protein [Puia sp.]
MKTLLIIRHAKSSWDNINTPDIERPLNDRGKKDAPAMARKVIKKGIRVDCLVSSPARRTRSTAQLFAREFNIKDNDIVILNELYHAPPAVFQQVIIGLKDEDNTVALFSHNPGITAFVNTLSTVRLDNMPTCAVFAVKSDSPKWSEFFTANREFLFFDYPKSATAD